MDIDPTRLVICSVCAGLNGDTGCGIHGPQRCACPGGQPREGRWPDGDFNEHAALCWCCQLEVLGSGSRFSPFFCPPCRTWARACNDRHGRLLIPIGRHTLMNGVAVRDPADSAQVRALLDCLLDNVGFHEQMDRWRPHRIRLILEATFPSPPGRGAPARVPLVDYLGFAAGLHDDARLGKRAAFEALLAFLGLPPCRGRRRRMTIPVPDHTRRCMPEEG
jgi:hypothetical protein